MNLLSRVVYAVALAAAANRSAKPLGGAIARIAEKLPGHSVESGGLSGGVGNVTDLEMIQFDKTPVCGRRAGKVEQKAVRSA